MKSPSGRLEPPSEFEEYRLLHPLGHGAMGQVFLAQDTLLDRRVAVKFIATAMGRLPDAAARARFFQEARAVARLQHPNVVAIHRVGEVRGQPYLVSEFIQGEPLDRLQRPVDARLALQLGRGLARGLAAAHRRGILHRDIKPANAILSEDGEVKLLDFGLAEAALAEVERSALAAGAPPVPGAKPAGPRPLTDTRPLPGPSAPDTGPHDGPLTHSARRPGGGAGGPDDLRPDAGTRGRQAAAAAPGTATQEPNPRLRDGAGVPDTGPGDFAPPGSNEARHDLVPGTPLYLAPELWRGEPASRASDVYALGVLLYELCAGRAPHDGVPLELLGAAVQAQPPPPLAERAPGVSPALAAIVDRCLAADPARRYESGDALREALEALSTPTRASALPSGNPYLGLRAFDAAHRSVFFGREPALREVLDRLRGDTFVLVAGDSGVGKSSLCRAGVLPAVSQGGLEDGGPAWTVLSGPPGRRPLDTWVELLAPLVGESAESLGGRLATEEPGVLARALRRRPADAAPLLLFIDQLEELVTFSEPAQAARLAEELALVPRRAPRVRLLATARSDCLTRLVALPGLGDEVPRALHLLRALSAHGLREAVEGPLRMQGLRFETPAMVDALVASAARAEGGLPLLQFALEALWEARDVHRQRIPAAALEALGGVEGALARHADAVVARLRPEQRPRARELLLELVTPEGTRLRRTREELLRGPGDDTGREVLDGLVRGRLLTAGEAEDGDGVYTLAHESLVTGWDTLRGWLGRDEQRRAVRLRLERAAAEWARLGRPAELLYGTRQLQVVRAAGLSHVDGARERDFLARSRAAARRQRLTRWLAVALVPLVLGGVVGVTRVQAQAQLDARINRHLDEARAQQAALEGHLGQLGHLRFQAFTLFDTPGPRNRQAAEAVWTQARQARQAVEETLLRAMSELEAAWGLAPGNPRVSPLMANLLVTRVELAEQERQPEQRAQWLARLAVHDAMGELRQGLTAPALVSLTSEPAGARVRLLEPTPEGEPLPGRELGQTPLHEVALPAGSHLLVIEAPGRFPVRVPVLLASGERLALEVPLPATESVPAGFVHIPAGRFLQGASESEYLRRAFFFAPPLHPVETGAYLIARHEVTFAQYIAFLETLPPEERAARMPGSRRRITVVDLAREPDGRWRLTLRPASASYSVRDGELLRYGKRDRRQEQDWLRFPVSAVSFDDALAYVAWLDRTGQVPGARMCTEREWERAARGADGRRYPSGDWLAPDDANHDVTYGREPWGFGPDEVGSHPRSRSPFGVDDLAGNVWEWTRSNVDPEKPSAQGGSWYQSDLTAHAANRDRVERTQREALTGFRVCATPRP
ncbi:protein kinase domain-containing protein [Corallococcus macrosporus]|uniref:non-specific serine/threonine protein kinase n=1 Tax=Corallococcus macrosporus DSM 14697 TaxID=1189310 RepID=A0A250JNB1_9BACT|nr:SUMF1/EgtB/PvdO family nonheme iron enzyme [Corallococcus macrosporus]ATB45345.1 serine/threonine protein kinase [Corallococcus macrosporus DSM 14697]